jgi:hypothetical protein
MKILKKLAVIISIGALALSPSAIANAVTIGLITTLDGTAVRSSIGSLSGTSTGDTIAVKKFSGILRELRGILEFDLSAIADGSTINSASLDITLVAPVTSRIGGLTNNTTIRAYAGDNVINGDDYPTLGLSVFLGSIPGGVGGVAGDVRSFVFTTPAPIENFLATDILGLQLRASTGIFSFASLENSDFGAAVLNIDFTAPLAVVPLPAALPLYGTGLALMGFIGWRRKQRKAAV